jgi:hypothetical protein
MHDDHSPTGEPRGDSTSKEDLRVQAAVMALVLDVHPRRHTVSDLALNIAKDENDDSVERAVRDLTGIGLLQCPGGRVALTEAALHFDRLPLP